MYSTALCVLQKTFITWWCYFSNAPYKEKQCYIEQSVRTDTCELMQRLQYCSACQRGGKGGGGAKHQADGWIIHSVWEHHGRILICCTNSSAAPLLLLANRNTTFIRKYKIFAYKEQSSIWNLELLFFLDKKSQAIPYREFEPLTNIKKYSTFSEREKKD